MRGPDLVLGGFPKCGTTSVAAWLDGHQEISVSEPKEPRFFLDFADVSPLSPARYEQMLGADGSARYLCDATPDYLYSKTAIERIRQTSPNARFIVCIRPYEELAASLHQQELYNGNETVADFDLAWSLSSSRRNGDDVPGPCREPRRLDYEARARMGDQLAHCAEIFGRDRMLVLDLATVLADPEGAWTAAMGFLELDQADAAPPFPDLNRRREITLPPALATARRLVTVRDLLGLPAGSGALRMLRRLGTGPAAPRTADAGPVLPPVAAIDADRALLATVVAAGPSVGDPSGWPQRGRVAP